MFDTDLTRDYELATSFGISPRTFYEAGLKGALCDAEMKNHLNDIGQVCAGVSQTEHSCRWVSRPTLSSRAAGQAIPELNVHQPREPQSAPLVGWRAGSASLLACPP